MVSSTMAFPGGLGPRSASPDRRNEFLPPEICSRREVPPVGAYRGLCRLKVDSRRCISNDVYGFLRNLRGQSKSSAFSLAFMLVICPGCFRLAFRSSCGRYPNSRGWPLYFDGLPASMLGLLPRRYWPVDCRPICPRRQGALIPPFPSQPAMVWMYMVSFKHVISGSRTFKLLS